MHRIGISLPARIFLGKDKKSIKRINKSFGSFSEFLLSLKSYGVNAVEIRAIESSDKPDYVKSLFDTLENAGLDLTIHGTLGKAGKKEDVLSPLSEILTCERKEPLIVTVHALRDKKEPINKAAERTKKSLYEICEYSEKRNLPIKLCLELNREKGEGDPSVTCESVVDMVKSAGSDKVGICWDFGHYLYNCKMTGDDKKVPPKEFLELVAHTHIHGIHNGVTHYPVNYEDMPMLFEYINALKGVGYSGIYNIEMTLRYLLEGNYNLRNAYSESVQAVERALKE
ncbi:MAG TPA: TIM barrel protein [Clostridia bacterium]|nr:TIM barrel protein [Clostridia bacterium]